MLLKSSRAFIEPCYDLLRTIPRLGSIVVFAVIYELLAGGSLLPGQAVPPSSTALLEAPQECVVTLAPGHIPLSRESQSGQAIQIGNPSKRSGPVLVPPGSPSPADSHSEQERTTGEALD
jgi:hypothetical protein